MVRSLAHATESCDPVLASLYHSWAALLGTPGTGASRAPLRSALPAATLCTARMSCSIIATAAACCAGKRAPARFQRMR